MQQLTGKSARNALEILPNNHGYKVQGACLQVFLFGSVKSNFL